MDGTSLSASAKAFHLQSLTGLRAYLAFGVLISHLYIQIWGVSESLWVAPFIYHCGKVGVSAFFVLSGFVLFWNYPPEGFQTTRFYWHRLARVYPAYIFCLLLSVPLELHAPTFDRETFISGFILNAALLGNFSELSLGRFNSVGWTLSVEAIFYLCYPPLILWITRRSALKCFLVTILLWIAALALTFAFPKGLLGSYMFPLNRLFEFTLGITTAMAIPHIKFDTRIFQVVAWMSALALLYFVPLTADAGYVLLHHHFAAPFCALLIGSVAVLDLKRASPSFLSGSAIVFAGEISYALYLIHELFLRYFKHAYTLFFSQAPSQSSFLVKSVLVIFLGVGVFIAAAILHRLIEVPGRKLIRKWSRT